MTGYPINGFCCSTRSHHDGHVDDDAADERVAVGEGEEEEEPVGGPVSGGYANVTSGSCASAA